MSPVHTVHSVRYNSINIIQAPKISNDCVRFRVILQKALTATCFFRTGPLSGSTIKVQNCPAVCISPVQLTAATWPAAWNCCTVLYGARGGTAVLTGMLPVYWNFSSTWSSIALRSTQLLTAMSTRNISWWGKGGRCLGLKTLKNLLLIVMKSRNINLQELSEPV